MGVVSIAALEQHQGVEAFIEVGIHFEFGFWILVGAQFIAPFGGRDKSRPYNPITIPTSLPSLPRSARAARAAASPVETFAAPSSAPGGAPRRRCPGRLPCRR